MLPSLRLHVKKLPGLVFLSVFESFDLSRWRYLVVGLYTGNLLLCIYSFCIYLVFNTKIYSN